VTSREAALVACGEEAVRAYELVKTFYTRFGLALERTFADAVEGRRGRRGEPDVVTRLGGFEFCASASSKNSAGRAAERARGAVVVQVSGPLRPGVISGVDFLRRHGVKDAPRVAGQCEVAALNLAKAEAEERVLQLELG
jgi:hypothetical protein